MPKRYRIYHLLFSFILLCGFWQAADARVGNEVGDEAPDFSLPNTDNKIVTLSEHRGEETVILIFYRGQW